MEESGWEQKIEATTHILTAPSTTPSLHSQLFMSVRMPCYRNWDYPPLLPCPGSEPRLVPDHVRWGFGYLYLRRAMRFGYPETSWRSKCPYQQPPPLILAEGVEEARWGPEDKREYVRKRMIERKRRRRGVGVNPLIPVLLPNIVLLSSLFWNPFPQYDN